MLAQNMLSLCICLSVCLAMHPSLRHKRAMYKTAKRRITQTTPDDSPETLVFWPQRSRRNSNGVAKYKCGRLKCELLIPQLTTLEVPSFTDSKDMIGEGGKIQTKVSAAADRTAQHSRSAHAKYTVSHHKVIKPFLLLGLVAEYTSQRWMWPPVVRQPSEVDDTNRQTKLTATETISRSRDMVGTYQNVNGSRDITTPLTGMVCHPWTGTCYCQPAYQIWSL